MNEYAWPAPAKLNLFLHIVGRRADGYHLLQSVFQFLDFGDRLSLEPRGDSAVQRRDDLPGVAEEQDLTVRAARLLQQATGCGLGVTIGIDKRIPQGGGLGGGSSDAATVLLALNRLWRTGLSPEQLAALGLRLGADVPIFVFGQAAWAEGIGDRLTPVQPPTPWYLVVAPPVHVPTAALFADPELTRDCPPLTIRDFLAGAGANVFEPVVRRRYPIVAEALDWLSERGPARMTGSGGCIFAPFADRETALGVLRDLPSHWQGFVARGLNRSPMLDALEAPSGSGREFHWGVAKR